MNKVAERFQDHFDHYGCHYYTFPISKLENLSQEEDKRWLVDTGLPDSAIPFFFFDTLLGELREVSFPDTLLILGSAFEPASHHYIVVKDDLSVNIRMNGGNEIFVNSSISQLCASMLAYSSWLEDQELLFTKDESFEVGSNEIFDIYYRLRKIDKVAFEDKSSIWPQLIHAEIKFLQDALEME